MYYYDVTSINMLLICHYVPLVLPNQQYNGVIIVFVMGNSKTSDNTVPTTMESIIEKLTLLLRKKWPLVTYITRNKAYDVHITAG